MRSVDFQTVLFWNPCPEYQDHRIEQLFAGRKRMTLEDAAGAGIPVDDFLWFALHEPLLTPHELAELRDRYLDHLQVDVDAEGVADAVERAIQAAYRDIDCPELYGNSDQAIRWRNGASEPARRAALTGLWCAIALARSAGPEQEARSKAWQEERTWQAMQVLQIGGEYAAD